MSGRLGCLMLIAWAAGANASPDIAPMEGTCNRPADGTCISYQGGGITSAQLKLLFERVCAPGTWTATSCSSSPRIGVCRFTERTDIEDMGITQTVHVYAASGATEARSRERCASADFEGMSAAGVWESGVGATSTTAVEPSSPGGICEGTPSELLALNIDQLACESDEVQFGFRP